MPQPSSTAATSPLPESSTIGNAADSWCRHQVPQRHRLCRLNHRRLSALVTADAATKFSNGNVSVAWTIEDWQCCWQLMPQPCTTTATSLLPESLRIGNAADGWFRYTKLYNGNVFCVKHRRLSLSLSLLHYYNGEVSLLYSWRVQYPKLTYRGLTGS